MSRHDDDGQLADDEPLARPFLTRGLGGAAGPGGGQGTVGGQGTAGGQGPYGSNLPAWMLGPDPDSSASAPDSFAFGPDSSASGPAPPGSPTGHGAEVRPYLLTGGRTQARGAQVAMETVVLATGASLPRGFGAAGMERTQILQLCDRPCSAAEVAARLELPLGVALVLVTDLVADGLLEASTVAPRQADDVFFLERLIAGVAAL
jgi:hypothetical protein